MEYKNILYEKRGEDKAVIITFNRPEARNAMSVAMLTEFNDALHRAADDKDVWCIVVTGAGDKAFCSGGDAKEFLANVEAGKISEIEKFNRFNLDVWRFMEKLRKPIIAAVNGYCNIETIQAVDLVIASEKAKFGLPEVTIGVSPGAGITVRLPRFLSKYWAKYLLFTGEWISAEEAYRLGFVNKVVPHEKLMEETLNLVRKITKNAPLAVGATKACVNLGGEMPIDEGMEYQLKESVLMFYTNDLKEGIKARFYEKREPQFRGE
ncbi:MAG TPA: enoyl-CoA hydratase/isomerase family protein [Candidatus Caldiarchaeum subterraneum]|uniref:Enoyl-CoA hydratase/isomerase family protein n=1 Tax=Caldiarchaeum subterraneum TaxID=311458 RepID=A0A832ZVV2_CALS0|nr:enoyl-CoA hydratase/isomerase family protein [Aigarchaeota archaeon]HIQ29829.1 enoyl-CoA hydratase/isomerase family protein [Candidatus Caldarchaeum subterraneum]